MNRKRPLNEKEIWELLDKDCSELDLSSDESDDEVKDPEFQLTPFQQQLLGEDGEDPESVDDPDSPDEEEIIEQPEDEDESVQRPPAKKCKKTAKNLPKWTSKRFQGRPIPSLRQQIPPPAVKKFDDSFRDYFDEDFFEDAAKFTNMYSAKVSGKSFNTDRHELRRFVGCCYIMGVIKYPRLKMYWQREYAFPAIAETMSRDRFLTLRVIFHLVDTSLPPPDDVDRNRLWKVQPIIDAVRSACGRIPRDEVTYSVDEQMIPFDGRCSMKQYVKNKPRPRGLKNVVITSSTGQVCDFEIFQGASTDLPDRELGLGPAFVLRLARTLPEKSFLYFDRYFTTIPLLETLKERKMEGTGTIMANRVKGINFAKQNDMQRGQSKEYVSENGQIVVVEWKDNNKVILASTCHGIHPNEAVQRWSKQEGKYVEISCPAIVRNYNQYMGGVDVCDQQMEYYRSFFKTIKWTWKVIMHFYDLAVVNIWFKYRKDSQANNAKFVDLMTLKLSLADVLTHSAPPNPQPVLSSEGEHSEPEETPRRRSKFANHAAKLPTMEKRRDGYRHTPVVDDLKTARACRLETCKSRTRTRCAKCNVYLCLAKNQNCFQEFHA